MNTDSATTGSRFDPKIVWALIIFTVVYRIFASQVPSLSNSSPTMALCFGGGLLLGRKFWWLPAVLILGSDFLIGLRNGGGGIGLYTLLTVTLFCGAAWFGNISSRWNGRTWPTMWCGVLACSIIFYAAANTFVWVAYPGYAKTLAGWWQSQTVGLPQYSPQSWVFLRNAVIGDSAWCLLAGLLFFFNKGTVAVLGKAEPSKS